MDDFTRVQNAVARVADDFARERSERQTRRTLAAEDFRRLSEAGFLRTGVPAAAGGLWVDVSRSVRPVCGLLRTIARGDSSVALVASMHPAVLSYWLTSPVVDPACQAAWDRQREAVFRSAQDGAWWGTITSEPASGGDITRTKATAIPVATSRETASDGSSSFRLTGAKHFGSGWGIASYMVTTAIPAGESRADWFYLDVRGAAAGLAGATILAEWDGHGMTATQSHAVQFQDFPALRFAWPGGLLKIAAAAGGFIGCLFTAVTVGIVDVAMETARVPLRARRESLRPFELVEWTRAEQEAWLIRQAFDGMLRAVETNAAETTGDPRRDVMQGKLAVAELAESLLTRLGRTLGGGTYSRRSPFGFWLEDVRSLGFLRPPWPLAFEQLGTWL